MEVRSSFTKNLKEFSQGAFAEQGLGGSSLTEKGKDTAAKATSCSATDRPNSALWGTSKFFYATVPTRRHANASHIKIEVWIMLDLTCVWHHQRHTGKSKGSNE